MNEGRVTLQREVGLPGAVLLGLGSMVGTGVFVSIGIAAGIAGASLLPAIALAGAVAACNGLSSAQLAAAHPVSGGTYEYGYRWLRPSAGFAAGWLFLLAKSASAATAALGLSGYLLRLLDVDDDLARTLLALVAALAMTALVAGGIRRSNRGNAVVVTATLLGLGLLLAVGLPAVVRDPAAPPRLSLGWDPAALLHGAALMFVAFTGYGRIATLGEEVEAPRTTIPRAVGVTVFAVLMLYLGVAFVGLGTLGGDVFGRVTEETAAPLEMVAQTLGGPPLATVLALSAVTAMAGVLLNLVLGLSRVLLAMGRRGDLPRALAGVGDRGPVTAVWAAGGVVAALALLGNVETTWSFSAFTVLVYYALTNLAALRLGPEERRYPRWVPAAGLVGCLGLAFWVDPAVWGAGLGSLALGLLWHRFRMARR